MAKPRTARDYEDDVTAASRLGLAELMTVLGAYREALVLIGGWAPYLILETFGEPGAFQTDAFQDGAFQTAFTHVGSIDIDLVVDPIPGERPGASDPRGFHDTEASVMGEGLSHRHREVQHDLRARTLEGAEVALAHWFAYDFEAQLPDGAQTHVRVKVADVVGSLALKGIAIGERYAEKDAYDIWALCAHYPGGPAAVAEPLRGCRDEEPVRRGLAMIAEKFRARDAEGPTWVAMFVGSANAEEHERIRTDAHMTVSEVLRILG